MTTDSELTANLMNESKPTQKVVPMFFLIDLSGSMYRERIAAVNTAMNQLWPELQKVQDKETLLDIQVRTITFGIKSSKSNLSGDGPEKYGAEWYVGDKRKGVSATQFQWTDIPVELPDGGTPTHEAINLLLECIGDGVYRENIGRRFTIPLIMLISDGESSSPELYADSINKLMTSRIGEKAVMCAVGIDTLNNPKAVDELKLFGRNGFKDCSDMSLTDLAKLVSTATFRTIKVINDTANGVAQTPVDVFDDDEF